MIDDIRRENMATLVSEFHGVLNLANRLERSESQVSQWLNGSMHSATGKRRGMRSATARYIEIKCGKEEGWLDKDQAAAANTIATLTVPMFALPCTKCGKVSHKSFLELELNDTIACPACNASVNVADYYGLVELETILKSLGGSGFALRKRKKVS